MAGSAFKFVFLEWLSFWFWVFGMGGVTVTAFWSLSSSMALLDSFDDGGMELFCSVDGSFMMVRDAIYELHGWMNGLI